MLSTTAHHAVLNTSRSQRYGISLTYMAHVGGVGGCEKSSFCRRSWSEWLSAKPFPSRFLESGQVTSAQILLKLQFPSSAAFRRRVEDFRRVHGVTQLYLRFAFMRACLWTHLHGGAAIAGRAGIPYSYGSFVTLYSAIRGICSLPVYSCYDIYNALRRS